MNLQNLKYDRKPEVWSAVKCTVPAIAVHGKDLAVYNVDDLGIRFQTLKTFAFKPTATIFLVRRDVEVFLINTDGYDYARYVCRVV